MACGFEQQQLDKPHTIIHIIATVIIGNDCREPDSIYPLNSPHPRETSLARSSRTNRKETRCDLAVRCLARFPANLRAPLVGHHTMQKAKNSGGRGWSRYVYLLLGPLVCFGYRATTASRSARTPGVCVLLACRQVLYLFLPRPPKNVNERVTLLRRIPFRLAKHISIHTYNHEFGNATKSRLAANPDCMLSLFLTAIIVTDGAPGNKCRTLLLLLLLLHARPRTHCAPTRSHNRKRAPQILLAAPAEPSERLEQLHHRRSLQRSAATAKQLVLTSASTNRGKRADQPNAENRFPGVPDPIHRRLRKSRPPRLHDRDTPRSDAGLRSPHVNIPARKADTGGCAPFADKAADGTQLVAALALRDRPRKNGFGVDARRAFGPQPCQLAVAAGASGLAAVYGGGAPKDWPRGGKSRRTGTPQDWSREEAEFVPAASNGDGRDGTGARVVAAAAAAAGGRWRES
ncbi:hypothetical protein FN846DRAFT_894930 [Sphaerosporella brunnea]|uniref:Uncharacterized protein n=1 Tax=Sphaerosporella brunnea TaxID=1250544 RepID=A0A5J5EFX3_9PEZI|nr:hypothetical protein FN846DRAFT_894930 [Sphaerosporella brunnea]